MQVPASLELLAAEHSIAKHVLSTSPLSTDGRKSIRPYSTVINSYTCHETHDTNHHRIMMVE